MSVRKVTSLFAVLALFLLLVAPILAQDTTPMKASTEFYVESFRKVNVRSGPSAKYTKIGTLVKGDTADITGRTKENNWIRIDFGGQEGWVSFPVVTVHGNIDDAPIATAGDTAVLAQTNAQAAAASAKNVTVVTKVDSRLHATTEVSSEVLTVIPFGTKLTATARTDSKNRLKVTYDGKTGWIVTSLVNITGGNIDTLPVEQ